MHTRSFWIKPNAENVPVPFDGQGDHPGPANHGTPECPVIFSAGALSEWIYDPALTPDPEDEDFYEYEFHFVPGLYFVGPDKIDGLYLQGSTCIYIQPNPARPKRKVIVRLIGAGINQTTLRFTSRAYTKEQTDTWTNGIEDAVIRSAPSGYVHEIEVSRLTIDSNFEGQGNAATGNHYGYKLHGIQIRARRWYLHKLRVIGCGANSDTKGGALTAEAFPINCYSLESDVTSLIRHCTVEGF